MRRRRAAANGSARDSRGSPRQPIAAALSRPEHPGGPRPRRRRAPPPPETPRVSVIPRLSPGYPTGNAAGPGYPPGNTAGPAPVLPRVLVPVIPPGMLRLPVPVPVISPAYPPGPGYPPPPVIPRVPESPRERRPGREAGAGGVPGVIRSFSFGL